jgi:hypothetical protein
VTVKFPIEEQIEAVEKMLTSPRLTTREIEAVQAAVRTLKWTRAHRDVIKESARIIYARAMGQKVMNLDPPETLHKRS